MNGRPGPEPGLRASAIARAHIAAKSALRDCTMTEPSIVPTVEPGTRPELADIERDILAARGQISVLYQALLNSAPIAAGWEKLLTAVRKRTLVRPDLRELIILRVAVINRALYEFEAHVPHALKAGMTHAKIEAVRTFRRPLTGGLSLD